MIYNCSILTGTFIHAFRFRAGTPGDALCIVSERIQGSYANMVRKHVAQFGTLGPAVSFEDDAGRGLNEFSGTNTRTRTHTLQTHGRTGNSNTPLTTLRTLTLGLAYRPTGNLVRGSLTSAQGNFVQV